MADPQPEDDTKLFGYRFIENAATPEEAFGWQVRKQVRAIRRAIAENNCEQPPDHQIKVEIQVTARARPLS